ncbi:MAG TPA: serine hydrolase, partial [Bacteroidia bacterium]|nr:serine hydrolase [Bacteroidia bacterium]
EISQDEVDSRCRKILMVKQWCGLDKNKTVKTKNLSKDLNQFSSTFLCREIAENAITLLKNDSSLIPFKHLDTLQIAEVSVGKKDSIDFQQRLNDYAPMKLFSILREAKDAERDTLIKKLSQFNLVILSLHGISQKPANNFGVTDMDLKLIDTLTKMGKKVVVDVFGPAYAVNDLPGIEKCSAVVMSYEDQDYLEDLSAQLLFGGISASGKLPVTTNYWKAGTGISTPVIRLKYTMPEEIGFSRNTLEKLDSVVADAIKQKAFPGCQLFIAVKGKVIYQKSYGYFTYEPSHAVQNDDLYDIASVTKIMATVPSVMRMVDLKQLNIDEKLSAYLPEVVGTNKQDIVIREMMAHQAGLQAWIPFYLKTIDKNGNLRKDIFRHSYSDSFPTYVAPSLFISKSYKDSIYKAIDNSEVSSEKKFLYSDLGFYYLKKIIENKSHILLSEYAMDNFYSPLGLTTMGYQPRLRFQSSRCAPTENDTKFRHQQLQGDVHDQGAAML